jgi:AcrR family transcriptional regulator
MRTPTAATDTWGREDSPEVAVARLLDAAGVVFAEKGVLQARMGDVAVAAGCSRGTLYRYFADRDQLRQAYVDREAARVGAHVLDELAGIDEPEERLVVAILTAVDAVRHDPFLRAWFDPASAATAGHLAMRGEVIAELIDAFLADLFAAARAKGRLRPAASHDLAVEWIVRVVLSLLTEPAAGPAGPDHERALLEQLLLPALFRTSERHQRSDGGSVEGPT